MNNLAPVNYFKNLDGLRTIAAFSVIFFHITWWFVFPEGEFYDVLKFILSFGGDGGVLGVTFFFILSGFLITYLMFREQSETGSLHIPHFYLRRILRIWPLYYLTLLVGFLIYPWLANMMGHTPTVNSSAFLYAIFAANFDAIYNGNPLNGMLGVQWSVAVEEQFYLIWPLLFYFLGKTNHFYILLLLVFVLSEMFFINSETWGDRYFHLFSNFRFLAWGGLLAYLCFFKEPLVNDILRRVSKLTHLIIYASFLLLMLFQHNLIVTFPFYKYIYHFIPFIFFGFVIVEQNFSPNSFLKIGTSRSLSWLGKISYGLYLTHMIALYIVLGIFPLNNGNFIALKIVSTLGITILISYLSYTYMELFFLSVKNKFSRKQ